MNKNWDSFVRALIFTIGGFSLGHAILPVTEGIILGVIAGVYGYQLQSND